MSKQKNSKDVLEFIHTLDSIAIKKQKEEIERLKAENDRLRKAGNILFTACNPAHVGTIRRIAARKSWVEANKEESK